MRFAGCSTAGRAHLPISAAVSGISGIVRITGSAVGSAAAPPPAITGYIFCPNAVSCPALAQSISFFKQNDTVTAYSDLFCPDAICSANVSGNAYVPVESGSTSVAIFLLSTVIPSRCSRRKQSYSAVLQKRFLLTTVNAFSSKVMRIFW